MQEKRDALILPSPGTHATHQPQALNYLDRFEIREIPCRVIAEPFIWRGKLTFTIASK
jgi:hypothetical protein